VALGETACRPKHGHASPVEGGRTLGAVPDEDDFESREQELADPNPRPWDTETPGSLLFNVGPAAALGAVMRSRRCSYCKGRLGKGASVCKHCGRSVALESD